VDCARSKGFWEKLGAQPVHDSDALGACSTRLWTFGEGVELYELPLQPEGCTIVPDAHACLIREAVYRRKLDAAMESLDAAVRETQERSEDVRAKQEEHLLCCKHRLANVNLVAEPKCIDGMAMGGWGCSLVVGKAVTHSSNGSLPLGQELTHAYTSCHDAWNTCNNGSNPGPQLLNCGYGCGCADCSEGDVAMMVQH